MAGEEVWGQKIQGRGRWGGGEKGPVPRALQRQGLRREGGGRKKEDNAGEWAGSGEDEQWRFRGLPSEGREKRRRGRECG